MGKVIHVIGCGETGSQWHGEGDSIGLNDYFKFGKRAERLILMNAKFKFTSERLKYILACDPLIVYSHLNEWKDHFNVQLINDEIWDERKPIVKGRHYCSKTSSFYALCLAWNLGYTDCVLWGVDFNNHVMAGIDKPRMERFAAKIDMNVWLGCEGSALNFPVYK